MRELHPFRTATPSSPSPSPFPPSPAPVVRPFHRTLARPVRRTPHAQLSVVRPDYEPLCPERSDAADVAPAAVELVEALAVVFPVVWIRKAPHLDGPRERDTHAGC